MEEMANLIANYGVSFVIILLFLWDWVSNKKMVNDTLKEIDSTNKNIANCLDNIAQNNQNISKTLDLLQKSMESQDDKIDKLLERR